MRSYLAVFVLALVASVALTPLARRLALRLNAFGSPGGRNVHARSIPRLGGLAIAVAWCIAVLALLRFGGLGPATLGNFELQLLAVMVGGCTLCVVGAVDDVRGLRAVHKLLAQVAVAVLAYSAGFRIEAIHLPLFGTLSMGIFALPVTVIWIVGVTNALNLIDGLDGLAAGVSFFAALTSFVVANVTGNVFVALLMAALMGVLAGFLFFNFNPARIFMGDSGSYFLGFILATLSLTGALQQKASTTVSLLVPMIALGLPIFDTLLSMLRRFLERRSIFSPDRGHIHHRLLDLGLTHRRAVMLLYGVCVVFTASAIAVSLGRTWQTGLALLSVSIVFVGLVRFVGYFEYLHTLRRQKSRLYHPHTERLRRAVPALLARLDAVTREEDVLEIVDATIADCALERVEIERDTALVHDFGSTASQAMLRDLVRATYPLGRDDRARAKLRFSWFSGEPDVSPQVSILLQLLADGVAEALRRTGSKLAERPAADPMPSYAPATLPVASSSSA